ncbi:MAG: hypothetical protein VKJ24_18755 [Synechococcales bacterium]|nr:hypothetical protein [Synechococcales bacterium]
MKLPTPLRCLTALLATSAIACGDLTQMPSQQPPSEQSRPVAQAPNQPSLSEQQPPMPTAQQPLPDGKYPLQQASYDDSNGLYTAMILNAPPGFGSAYRQENLPMARLTAEEIQAGEKSYLKVENGKPALYLTEDFKIEYVHHVVQERANPDTGAREQVIVRQEPSFWSPFAGSLAGSLAGQAIGSFLFRPQYYVPPQYAPGRMLVGYGGYGESYREANNRYQERYRELPAAERNRTIFRTAGRQTRDRLPLPGPGNTASGNNSFKKPTSTNSPSNNSPSNNSPSNTDLNTGSGYGSSNLRSKKRTEPKRQRATIRPSNRRFGSKRSSNPGFGSQQANHRDPSLNAESGDRSSRLKSKKQSGKQWKTASSRSSNRGFGSGNSKRR